MKAALTLWGVLIAASVSASAQGFQIDHFKCYFPAAVTQVQPSGIVLQDQFGTNQAVVGRIFRLCNPTVKYHNGQVTPITHPDDHLTLHLTGPQPLVTREVNIVNQFGNQTLILQDAKVLAVPTKKDPHDAPKDINHFSCYVVSNGPQIDAPIALADQFFGSRHRLMRPALFCNPVQKTHNGNVIPITNPDDHLTCYTTTRAAVDRTVDLHNQFGDHKFRTAYADMACVPTKKLSWHVID